MTIATTALGRSALRGVRGTCALGALSSGRPLMTARRCNDDVAPLVVVEHHERTAIVTLASPPINALTRPLVTQLTGAIRELEATEHIEGFVLRSGVRGVFTGGLHLPELLLADDGSNEAVAAFWHDFQELALALHGTPLATVAAISGACPAGGCLLALCCDERTMDRETAGSIGLNEAAFGLLPPYWLCELMIGCVGQRRAERMITRGQLLPPEDALNAGLVDELVPSAALHDVANARLLELLAIPGRAIAKAQLRTPWQAELRARRDADRESVLAEVSRPAVQSAIVGYLEALRRKRERKKG